MTRHCRHYGGISLSAPWRGPRCNKGWPIPASKLDTFGCTRDSSDNEACLFREPLSADQTRALENRIAKILGLLEDGVHE